MRPSRTTDAPSRCRSRRARSRDADDTTGGARARTRSQQGAWSRAATRLAAAGFSELSTVTYGIDDDVPAIAARIAEEVEAVITSRAIDRVHLVGHSLGGVAIRYWYDVLDGNRRADAVVTLGAPLRGTVWTRLPFLRPPARDLLADSPVSRTLSIRKRHHDRWTTVGGTFDVVVPPARAHLDDAEVVDVPAGHAGLLTSAQAAWRGVPRPVARRGAPGDGVDLTSGGSRWPTRGSASWCRRAA